MKPAILCLNSEQFNRDVLELGKHGKRYEYLLLPDTLLIDGQPWVPPPLREQSAYVNFKGPTVDKIWDKSRRFGLAVIDDARRSGKNVVAVMSGNWDYWNDEGLRLACTELGLPFLVLLRESYLNTYGLQENIDYFSQWRRIPQPDAVAMAGPLTVTLFEKLNLFQKAPMISTGWPRFDVWRRPATPLLDRPVVLMSYFRGYYADQHFQNMMVTFNDLARQYPHVPFVIKAKHLPQAELLQQIRQDRGFPVPIADVLELPSLICNARAVIGFNSMVMFESLLSPAQIILPYWGETAKDPGALAPSPLDTRLDGHMMFAESEEMLRQMVAWAIHGQLPAPDMEARRKAFSEYFAFDADRTNVERVEDFIDAALEVT